MRQALLIWFLFVRLPHHNFAIITYDTKRECLHAKHRTHRGACLEHTDPVSVKEDSDLVAPDPLTPSKA